MISIKEISTACGGKFFGPPEVASQKTTAIKIDSRKIEAGAVLGQDLAVRIQHGRAGRLNDVVDLALVERDRQPLLVLRDL